jgi:hypothetical protein
VVVEDQRGALGEVQVVGELGGHERRRDGDVGEAARERHRGDPVARGEAAAVGRAAHDAGHLAAGDERRVELHLVLAARHEQVGERDARGVHVDDHAVLAGDRVLGPRLGDVDERDGVWAVEGLDLQGADGGHAPDHKRIGARADPSVLVRALEQALDEPGRVADVPADRHAGQARKRRGGRAADDAPRPRGDLAHDLHGGDERRARLGQGRAEPDDARRVPLGRGGERVEREVRAEHAHVEAAVQQQARDHAQPDVVPLAGHGRQEDPVADALARDAERLALQGEDPQRDLRGQVLVGDADLALGPQVADHAQRGGDDAVLDGRLVERRRDRLGDDPLGASPSPRRIASA